MTVRVTKTAVQLPDVDSSEMKAASVGARRVTPSAGVGTDALLVASSVLTICAAAERTTSFVSRSRQWKICLKSKEYAPGRAAVDVH